MTKILISGYYGFNNIGDDAILTTVVNSIRQSIDDADITVLSNSPKDTSEKFGVKALPRMSMKNIIKAVKGCDILISGGGSLLQDATSRISILYYLFIIRLAIMLKKKIFIYSQGIGPINSKFNRKLTASCLKRVDCIAVRDEKSARFLKEIGVPEENVDISADPVLRLQKADTSKGREILESIGCSTDDGRIKVGFAVKSDDTNPEYINELERSIRWLHKEKNADCILIPFHYEQDNKVITELSERLGNDVFSVTDKHLSDEMLSIIGNMDVLVGVRLHSLIYAAVMDVPSIGISYDPKIDAFMESISRKAVSTTGDFTLEKFKEAFEDVRKNRDEIIATGRSHVNGLIEKLEHNDESLKEMIRKEPEKEKKKRGGIIAAIGGVMMITVVSKIFGVLRESVQANVFGSADNYYAGYNKTIYLFTTVAYAMCVAAVPILTKQFARDRKGGERTANNLTTLCLGVGLIAMLVMEIASFIPPVCTFLYGSTDPEAILFIRIMALSLPVVISSYLMVAIFQSLDHYTLQGSMAVPYSVFLMLYLVIFGRKLSLTWYVVMVAVAWLLQLGMSVPYAVKERYLYRPHLDLKQNYIWTFIKTVAATIITSSMYLFCYLIDAARAAGLGEGTTSAFYYADKLFTPLTTTFIYSISAVMFPKLNREYTKTNKNDYLSYVWNMTSNTLVIVFPICALLIVFGQPILTVLFQSGNFTAEATALTSSIFTMYALGMAGFSALDLLTKAFYTMNKSLAPLLISLGVIAMNFVLDLVFGMSGEMLALMTALSMIVGALVTSIVLFRGSKVVKLWDMLKSAIASLITGGAAYGLKMLLVSGDEGKILLVIKCGAIGVVAVVVFFLLCMLFRLDAVTGAVMKKFGRKKEVQ